ncbi:cytochrome c oxidase assembly protein [Luteimonas sp. RIT-PG2_3]
MKPTPSPASRMCMAHFRAIGMVPSTFHASFATAARRPRVLRCLLACVVLAVAAIGQASAHPADTPPTWGSAWSLSPWILVPFALLLCAYARGLWLLWRRAGIGHGISTAGASAFALGMTCLWFATIWPLDAYGSWSLAAHMAQHMLLLALVPPLLLAGQPQAAIATALPRQANRIVQAIARRLGRVGSALTAAAIAHSLVMWAWHVPTALTRALAFEPLHWLMHASFLVTGLWYWHALLQRLRDPRTGSLPALGSMVAVMMQMGLIGALLTFSPRPLYAIYAGRTAAIGLDPLHDQQLAGLLMWVPSCLPYLFGAFWLTQRELSRWSRRA